jgi:cell division protein FtsL
MKFLIGTLLWTLALAAVWEKVDIYRSGYAIEQLRATKKSLQHQQRVLELELARITAPEQIERLAVARLGMVRPRYNQVVLVGPRQKPADSPKHVVVPVAHIE